RWAEILGYAKEDIIPTFADTEKFVHPDDRERMHAFLNEHLLGKTDYYRCRFRMKTRAGNYKWILSVARVMEYDDNGKPLRMLGIHQDIDEQKKIEDELILARTNAEDASKAKSIFLANMSHEIRTPMNAILGYTQLMQRDEGLTDVQRKYLEIINHSGTHLLDLINDILEMSKIEAGRTRVNAVIFDFRSMLEDIEMMFHVKTSAQNVMLRTVIDEKIPRYIKSDENKIRQILINLIGNAVKFTSSGHIVISVNCGLQSRQPSEDNLGDIRFRIDVEDTGCGIAAGDMDKIFEAFEQSRAAVESGGTGLGLPISREYARMLGGDITAKSEAGIGSTFTVEFVAQYVDEPERAAVEAKITKVTGLTAGRNSASVLVVDDRETNRALLVDLLDSVGFYVRHADNGLEALKIVQEWQPDVILMDRRMPVMDGYEAMRKIKDTPNGKNIPVLIVTASAFEENRTDAMGYGAAGFIRKPYNEAEIFDAIRRATGIEYVYDKAETFRDIGNYQPSPQEMADLPERLRDNMRQALHDGDMERMQIFIERVLEKNGMLGSYLASLAEHYEYAALQKLLSPEKPPACEK
ncbi:MAG TPA: response regulator, partial [Phycisphaerae bacterium]|nr:response regulator [Phycisphaerae bacterium]